MTGIIVEPIQAEGGDHHGSNAWFQVGIKMMIMVVVINMVHDDDQDDDEDDEEITMDLMPGSSGDINDKNPIG